MEETTDEIQRDKLRLMFDPREYLVSGWIVKSWKTVDYKDEL